MARHKKYDLLEILVQAIHDSNWNVLYVSSIHQHPFLLRVYKDERSYLLRIYIWHLTHGGGFRRPIDEFRIQITGIKGFDSFPDEKTLILGWWNKGEVFAGFDYSKHRGLLGASPSIQIREEALRKAYINGMASHNKGNKEIELKKMGLDGEATRFRNELRPMIPVPPSLSDRPHRDFIREANKIRGWKL